MYRTSLPSVKFLFFHFRIWTKPHVHDPCMQTFLLLMDFFIILRGIACIHNTTTLNLKLKRPSKKQIDLSNPPPKKLTASNTSYPNSPIKIIMWERSTQYTKPIVSRNPAPRNEWSQAAFEWFPHISVSGVYKLW